MARQVPGRLDRSRDAQPPETLEDRRPILAGDRELILNWFTAKKEFNSGIVEGLKYKY